MFYITVIVCLICSVLFTPVVRKLAFRIGATDSPDNRKMHKTIMPSLGGLAIFLSFFVGVLLLKPYSPYFSVIFFGGTLVLITGILDDIYVLSAKYKLLGQLLAAVLVVMGGGLQIEFINIPFGGHLELHIFSIPLTILWIVGVTNSINLIDGLDGLAAGVCCIALFTISGMAFIIGDIFVFSISSILLAGTFGFLFFNFHPAKIFMGDTGALFLGFMISVLALLGFKSVTFISLIVPVIILGVPLSDTIFAIIRRLINKEPLSAPDKSHLHHCLIEVGFSHRQSVLIIYAMAAFFGLVAVIFSQASLWGSFILLVILVILIELIAEKIGLIGQKHRPLLTTFYYLRSSLKRIIFTLK